MMTSVTEFLTNRQHLKVNAEKSAVARPWERKFLGYTMTRHKRSRLKVAPSSLERMKAKVRMVYREGRGRRRLKGIEHLNRMILLGIIFEFLIVVLIKQGCVVEI